MSAFDVPRTACTEFTVITLCDQKLFRHVGKSLSAPRPSHMTEGCNLAPPEQIRADDKRSVTANFKAFLKRKRRVTFFDGKLGTATSASSVPD